MEWISIEQRMPTHNQDVFFREENFQEHRGYFIECKEGWLFCENNMGKMHQNKITHWMPLPEPPKEE